LSIKAVEDTPIGKVTSPYGLTAMTGRSLVKNRTFLIIETYINITTAIHQKVNNKKDARNQQAFLDICSLFKLG